MEKEIAMDVPLGDTDPVFQVPGGSAVAEWITVVVLVQVTVDPTVVLMDCGKKQNPEPVAQPLTIDTELAAALAGRGWLRPGPASINPRNATGTSLLMILTPNLGSERALRAPVTASGLRSYPEWGGRRGGRARACAPRRTGAPAGS